MAYDATVPWEGACAGGRCVMWGPRCGLECVWAGEDTMSHVPVTWGGGHMREAERSKEQVEASARAAHRDGETPKDTNSHKAASPKQQLLP